MKMCGLLALLLTLIGLILGLFTWVFWTFIVMHVEHDGPVYWAAQIGGLLETLCIFGALASLSAGAMASKRA